MSSDTEQKLRSFVLENFLFSEDDSDLENQVSFLDEGIVDSTGILEIIGFLEEQWGFKVPEADMVPENLDSINHLVAYVARRTAA